MTNKSIAFLSLFQKKNSMKGQIFIQGLFSEEIPMNSDSTLILASLQWKSPPTTGGDTVTLASRERSCDRRRRHHSKSISVERSFDRQRHHYASCISSERTSKQHSRQSALPISHSQLYAKLCEQRTCDQPLNNSLELNEIIFQSSSICVNVNEIIASPSSIDLTTSSVKQNKSKYPLKEAGNFFYKF